MPGLTKILVTLVSSSTLYNNFIFSTPAIGSYINPPLVAVRIICKIAAMRNQDILQHLDTSVDKMNLRNNGTPCRDKHGFAVALTRTKDNEKNEAQHHRSNSCAGLGFLHRHQEVIFSTALKKKAVNMFCCLVTLQVKKTSTHTVDKNKPRSCKFSITSAVASFTFPRLWIFPKNAELLAFCTLLEVTCKNENVYMACVTNAREFPTNPATQNNRYNRTNAHHNDIRLRVV